VAETPKNPNQSEPDYLSAQYSGARPDERDPKPLSEVIRDISSVTYGPLDGGFYDTVHKTAANIADVRSEVESLREERARRLREGEPLGDLLEQLLEAEARLQQLREPEA
jgi:hypothetical protein